MGTVAQYAFMAGIAAIVFGYYKVGIACLLVVAIIALSNLRHVRWTAKRVLVLAGVVAIVSPFAGCSYHHISSSERRRISQPIHPPF